ncbi:hypothetical protein [Pedobacter chinensis]|nr:hypothetical protein [Pedobacter chinensis]
MKQWFFIPIMLLAGIQASCQQKELFDMVAYTAPKGWQKSVKPGTLSFTKETPKGFCIITLYKGVEAGIDAQTNFDISWQSLMQETLGTGKATMQPGSTDNGWESRIGSAPFEKNGIKGAAILISSSKNGKLINISSMTNTDAFQKEMETFFGSLVLKGEATKANDLGPDNIQRKNTAAADKSTGKPELWMNRRIATSIYANPKTLDDLYLIYPNGDYFPNVPYEGLINVNRSFQPESWGKFTMQGNKGKFKNKYDEIAVTKKSDIQMEKDGYSYGFYKFLPVDGLRIEGAYTHVSSDWGKDPKLNYLSDPGCQFVIHFKKDGTFDDKGIFSTNKNNCIGGKGTYSIEDFTITFRYNDGRVVYRLFTAPPTRNPATYNEAYYIGHTAYYKKNNNLPYGGR